MLAQILPLLQTTILAFFSEDPVFRLMQGGLLLIGLVDVFLLFWTLRDALMRSQSLLFQMCALVMVFALPFAGFLLYLLIRPSSTLRERSIVQMVEQVLETYQKNMLQSQKKGAHAQKKTASVISSS
ncbi:hypothetical protein HYZ98_03070 [Candidatus Peregrinibacteria bacterium]|nr:hypothetical protein [Candidatus Peregrinibacteria bacterium]